MESSKSNVIVGLVVVAVVAGLIALLTSIRMVGNGEVGVVMRFGKVTGEELPAGIHLVRPFWFETVREYDIKVQKDTADATAASRDLQDVTAKLTLNYRLEPDRISDIHQNVGPDFKAKVIDPAVQEVFKAATARYDATQLIQDRASAKQDALKLLRERLDDYGIVVTDLSIVNFSFSKEFAKAIEAKQVAQQNAQRAEFNLEAARTDAKAQQVQAETLSPLFLQKLAIEKWNGHLPQYMGNGTVFNIPLGQR